jgi:hypothetical protein
MLRWLTLYYRVEISGNNLLYWCFGVTAAPETAKAVITNLSKFAWQCMNLTPHTPSTLKQIDNNVERLNSAKLQPIFRLATGFTVKSMVCLVETY